MGDVARGGGIHGGCGEEEEMEWVGPRVTYRGQYGKRRGERLEKRVTWGSETVSGVRNTRTYCPIGVDLVISEHQIPPWPHS